MKVYLIKASAPGPFKDYKKATGGPPQNIFSVAAATPEDVKIAMCDETIGMKPKKAIDADIVALFFHTPDAVHAYKLADIYRSKGKTVVLGGLHTTFMPDEAIEHADALLLGEAEGIWEQLLEDYKAGKLQKRYERTEPVDLAELNPYPTNIIPPSKYDHIWSVVVSRGCPHKCGYCTVPRFFEKYRLRPIAHVVEEIKTAPTDWFELHADNLTVNRKYALELFRALKPLNINWFGEATIKMADDEELLKAAAESGCRELLIGIETPSQAALDESGKGFVTPAQIKEKIDKFHQYNIQISSSMIFGFDTHTDDIFRESEEFCRYIGIDEVEGVLLIPFPGTPLHKKLEGEGRILTDDWSKYDGDNVVFQPKGMSAETLNEGAYWFWETLQKNKNIRTTSSSNTWQSRTGNKSGEATYADTGVSNRTTTFRAPIKWKAISGLTLIGIGFIMDWYWIWGILFLIWVVGDIKMRRTHLLEEVTRDESPVLYWIIIATWLFLSVIAFSTATAWATIDPEKSASIDVESGIIKDEKYGFSLVKPRGWVISMDENDQYSRTLTLEPRNGYGSVTVVGIRYQANISYEDMVEHMDDELANRVSFIRGAPLKEPDPPLVISDTGSAMKFRQFSGKYLKNQAIALLGYRASGQYGYCLLGMYGKNDSKMAQTVRSAMTTFTATR